MTSKKICYLIFNNSPSAIVRATTFKDEYLKYDFEPIYFNLFSKNLTAISTWLFVNKISLLALFFNKLNAIFEIIMSKYFLLLCQKYDAIIIIKYIKPDFLNKIKSKFRGKVLYDFDDAVWVDYIMGKDTFLKIIKTVDYVSCDNTFLLTYVKKYNSNSFILNGPTQVEKFTTSIKTRIDNKIVIGWVGSPDTLFYLYSIYDALEYIGEVYKNVVFRIVGAGFDLQKIPNFEKIKIEIVKFYDEKLMIKEVKNFDIGIFPLFQNDLSCGRGLLKAKIYMSASVASISSNIGTVSELVINSKNGFLCNNTNEWISNISKLIENPTLREEVANNGFLTVSENYSKNKCFIELKNNFLDFI